MISSAIKKYGKENFSVEEIDGANSLSELNYLEQHYIFIFNTRCPVGYNITNGGRNFKHSKESVEKSRLAKIGIKMPQKTREAIAKSRIGSKHSEETKQQMRKSALGKTPSEETKKKIGLANTGKKRSEGVGKKISLALKGQKRSEQFKQNLRNSRLGKKGHTPSEETKQKIRESLKRYYGKV